MEDIQDSVETVLIKSDYDDVAKAYILYRRQREKIRNITATMVDYKDIVDKYLNLNDWRVKENSTVTYSVGGLILSNSGALCFWCKSIRCRSLPGCFQNRPFPILDLQLHHGGSR